MAGPLGGLVDQASRLIRRRSAGFLMVADNLPADVVAAVEILHEEQQAYHEETRQRQEEIEAAKRELRKGKHAG